MRIIIVNAKSERLFISALMEKAFEKRILVSMSRDYVNFFVDEFTEFLSAVWAVYAEFSRDGRGEVIERKRFFKADDWPETFWYQLSFEGGKPYGLNYGRVS